MTGPETVVYTAIYGEYDVLIDPRDPAEAIDYICFTDENLLSSEVWDIRNQSLNDGLPPNLKNRRVKILAHEHLPKYDYSVYVDGNVQITGDIHRIVKKYQDRSFTAPRHFQRDCAYEEADVCVRMGKGDPEAIQKQMDHYRKDGFPRNFGLSANSILFRQHNSPEIRAAMNDWWNELQKWSSRDQLSLPYIMWKHDLDYCLMEDGPRLGSDVFRLHPHLPDWRNCALAKLWIQARAHRDQSRAYTLAYFAGRAISKLRTDGLKEFARTGYKIAIREPTRNLILRIGDWMGLVGPDDIYEQGYYEMRLHDPYRSEAHEIAKIFLETFDPECVIDFGCAIGAYLEPFHEAGIDITGVEGNSSALEYAVVPDEVLTQHDLRNPFETERQYDLVISIEVAEHIPQRYVDIYLDTLTGAGSPVVMSAAPPGQGGTHHVNEQPPEYWVNKMSERGYQLEQTLISEIQAECRGKLDVFTHVPENILVFVEK